MTLTYAKSGLVVQNKCGVRSLTTGAYYIKLSSIKTRVAYCEHEVDFGSRESYWQASCFSCVSFVRLQFIVNYNRAHNAHVKFNYDYAIATLYT